MPTVVFDFDKTLTRKDTVTGFLVMASGKPFVPFRILILLFFAVLHKLGIISNDFLKKTGIRLFLKGMPENQVKRQAEIYAQKIELNEIYHREYASDYPDAIIATASYEDYVRPLCKSGQLVAATLEYIDGKVSGLKQNAYGRQKLHQLNAMGITRIDIFYTDSYSDRSLMDISTVVYLVKNNGIKKIKG